MIKYGKTTYLSPASITELSYEIPLASEAFAPELEISSAKLAPFSRTSIKNEGTHLFITETEKISMDYQYAHDF